jgi:uncharacterized protein YjiK
VAKLLRSPQASRRGFWSQRQHTRHPRPRLSRYVLAQSTTVTSPTANFSSATYCPPRDTVLGISNGAPLAVYEYTRSGTLLRSWTLGTGFVDTESVCWCYDDWFCVSDEDTSVFSLIRLNAGNAGTTILRASCVNIDTGLGNLDGTTGGGFEGVAYDFEQDKFYACKERRSTAPTWQGMAVYEVLRSGLARPLFDAPAILGATGICTDLADLFYEPRSRHLFLLSQESNKVIECDLAGTVLGTRALPTEATMTQAEGIAISWDCQTLWLTGEPNQFRRFELAA